MRALIQRASEAHVRIGGETAGEIGPGLVVLVCAMRDDTEADDTHYRRPVPQLRLGQDLAPHVSAMMDVSDGLLLDASRIAAASNVTLSIDRNLVLPLAPEGRLEDAMRWGDDYVLLCTGPEGLDERFPFTRIGKVDVAGAEPLLLDGSPPEGNIGYTH